MTDYVKIAAKGTIIIFLMTITFSFLGYLIRMVLTRKLSPEEYGLFYAVFTIVNLLWLFKHLGLNNALVKITSEFFAKKDWSGVKSTVYIVFIMESIIALFLTVIFILLSKFLAINYFKSISAKWVLIILLLYFLISGITDVLVSFFLGWQKHTYYTLYYCLLNGLVLVFILFLPIHLGSLSPALAYLLSSIILSIVYGLLFIKLFPLSQSHFSWSNNLVKKLILFSIPMALTLVSNKIIGYVDILMLTYFRTLSEVGIYNVVLPTSQMLMTAGISVGAVLFPMASEFLSKGKLSEFANGLKIIYKYVFILIVPLGLLLFSFSEIILNIFFGEFYTQGILAMQILLVGTIFYTVGAININVLNGINKPGTVTLIVFIGMIVNVGLNLFIIPLYGINGAALATTVSYVLIFAISSVKVSKLLNLRFPWYSWFKTLVAGVILVLVMYLLQENIVINNVLLKLVVTATIGCGSYIICLFLFKLIHKDDLSYLKTLIFRL